MPPYKWRSPDSTQSPPTVRYPLFEGALILNDVLRVILFFWMLRWIKIEHNKQVGEGEIKRNKSVSENGIEEWKWSNLLFEITQIECHKRFCEGKFKKWKWSGLLRLILEIIRSLLSIALAGTMIKYLRESSDENTPWLSTVSLWCCHPCYSF